MENFFLSPPAGTGLIEGGEGMISAVFVIAEAEKEFLGPSGASGVEEFDSERTIGEGVGGKVDDGGEVDASLLDGDKFHGLSWLSFLSKLGRTVLMRSLRMILAAILAARACCWQVSLSEGSRSPKMGSSWLRVSTTHQEF
jgi:hypothetical protein